MSNETETIKEAAISLGIKEAIRLLGDEEKQHLTIEGIAKEVGFSSKSSFNPAFKKFTGLTPSQYLKQKLNV